MKKYKLLSGLVLLSFLATGCVNNDPDADSSSDLSSSISSSAESSSESEASSQSASSEVSSETEKEQTIETYFPFQENVQFSYLGEGNEFASFDRYAQYIEGNRVQLVTQNPGSTNIRVLEYVDGKLSQVFFRPETYFRENMLEKTDDEAGEILLMEPLEVGTSWDNPDDSTTEITAVDVDVETPLGVFPALEVTKTGKDSVSKSYYAKDMGLIKEEYTDNNGSYVVTSTLETRNEESPEVVTIKAYYPDANAMGLETSDVNVSFFTNDVTRKTMTDLLKQVPGVEYGKLISDNTSINSLYLNEDGRVYVDFSKELVEEMNAGSSGESLLLQGIVNTIGGYYGVQEVVLTVENKPYESGHYSMKPDESFKVDMEKVQE